jgi:hypothetical protein
VNLDEKQPGHLVQDIKGEIRHRYLYMGVGVVFVVGALILCSWLKCAFFTEMITVYRNVRLSQSSNSLTCNL